MARPIVMCKHDRDSVPPSLSFQLSGMKSQHMTKVVTSTFASTASSWDSDTFQETVGVNCHILSAEIIQKVIPIVCEPLGVDSFDLYFSLLSILLIAI